MLCILDKHLKLSPKDSKTNIPLPFFIEKEAEELVIEFSYSPKTPEDEPLELRIAKENIERDAPGEWGKGFDPKTFLPLKNLITVSLDDPDGYRGCAHRQPPEQIHILAEHTASPGFYPDKIKPGAWSLTLNVHALITETCDIRVKVSVRGEGEV